MTPALPLIPLSGGKDPVRITLGPRPKSLGFLEDRKFFGTETEVSLGGGQGEHSLRGDMVGPCLKELGVQ